LILRETRKKRENTQSLMLGEAIHPPHLKKKDGLNSENEAKSSGGIEMKKTGVQLL